MLPVLSIVYAFHVKVFVLADKGLSEDKIRMMDYGADEFAVKAIEHGISD
jgi:hypothetical protein